MHIRTPLLLAAIAATLSACQSEPREFSRTLPVAQQRPVGVEGAWADKNGLLTTFSAGRFETRTTDGTNTLMSSGTYTPQPSGVTQLSMFSNLSKTTQLVNCQLATSSQLNCTTEKGAQFSLQRRA